MNNKYTEVTWRHSSGAYPRIKTTDENLERGVLPKIIMVGEHDLSYGEYVFIGICKSTGKILQDAIVRFLYPKTFEEYLEEHPEIMLRVEQTFRRGRWYKITNRTEVFVGGPMIELENKDVS